MPRIVRSALMGAAMIWAPGGSASAQGFGGNGGVTLGGTPGLEVFGPLNPAPAFSSPYGGSQGFGYYPATYWPGPGTSQFFNYYYDVSVSSPHRPGSTNYVPPLGYFLMGDGPYVFPTGR